MANLPSTSLTTYAPMPAGTNTSSMWNTPGMFNGLPQSQPTQGLDWSKFLSSPGGAALLQGGMGLAGGIMSGKAQQANTDAQMQMERERLAEQQRQFNIQNSQQAASAPQFTQQEQRQKQALMAAILGGMRNVEAPAGMEGFMPSGGMRIPEGGFGADVMNFYTPEARAAAEAQFYSSNPANPAPDYATLGYGDAGSNASKKARSYYESQLAKSKGTQTATLGALSPTTSSQAAKTGSRNWLASLAPLAASIAIPALTRRG